MSTLENNMAVRQKRILAVVYPKIKVKLISGSMGMLYAVYVPKIQL
jgi:hypothetical protein